MPQIPRRPGVPPGILAALSGRGVMAGKRPSPPGAPPPQAQPGPNLPARPGGTNPYTGQPLGANEYVGVAGSEAQNPGMVRIPPPGWWDPSNPNYERRNYYRGSYGQAIAREPGFDPSEEYPWDSGRPGERNNRAEEGAGPYAREDVEMSEPGVPRWNQKTGRPGTAPSAPFAGQAAGQGVSHPSTLGALGGGLFGGPQQPESRPLLGPYGEEEEASDVGAGSDPLQALLAALLAKVPGRRPRPTLGPYGEE